MKFSRHLLFAMFAASLGFSWALATSVAPRGLDAQGAAARGVGTGLRFSNPFLLAGVDSQFGTGGNVPVDPQGFDLGEACFGSQVVRYLSALGGVTPYVFAPQGIGAGLTLTSAGRVSGAVPAGTGATKFTASVTDAAGVSRSGVFRLGTRDCPGGEFRFAMDRLPAAQVGQDYITNLAVTTGDATEFRVLAGSVTQNGSTISNLEFAGLTLYKDGTLAGRPLASGTLNFTARALRGTAVAQSKNGATTDQSFSISVAAESIVQSEMVVTQVRVRGDFGRAFRDQFDLRALINTNGKSNADFAGKKFTLRIAGETFETTLDTLAFSRVGDLRVAMSVPDGKLILRLTRRSIGPLLDKLELNDRGNTTIVVQIAIGDTFLATEAVHLDVRSKANLFKLSYKLGSERQLGGLFQITSVKALDIFDGTAFKIKFVLAHPRGRTTQRFGVATSATIHIGPNFHQTVPLFKGRGRYLPAGIRTLQIDGGKKIGVLTTYGLKETDTGIKKASASGGQPQTLLLGLDAQTTLLKFSGDASRKIFPFVILR